MLTDRDEMSNLYRGPSIDASYQVSIQLAEGFQRRLSKCEKLTDDERRTTKPSAGKSSHCVWQGELKMINLYRGPSIDASYQVSLHYAEGFQRRRLKCEP